MPFSAPVLTYRAKGLASNIQSKVLKVYNTLININITAISAPEMTYTPDSMGSGSSPPHYVLLSLTMLSELLKVLVLSL